MTDPSPAQDDSYRYGDFPCADCGTCDNVIWFTDNELWNTVVRDDPEREGRDAILCVLCFTLAAHRRGVRTTAWYVAPEGAAGLRCTPDERRLLDDIGRVNERINANRDDDPDKIEQLIAYVEAQQAVIAAAKAETDAELAYHNADGQFDLRQSYFAMDAARNARRDAVARLREAERS